MPVEVYATSSGNNWGVFTDEEWPWGGEWIAQGKKPHSSFGPASSLFDGTLHHVLSGVAIAAHQQHVLIYEGDGKQAEDNMHTNITSRLGLGPSCHYLCTFLIHFANCCQWVKLYTWKDAHCMNKHTCEPFVCNVRHSESLNIRGLTKLKRKRNILCHSLQCHWIPKTNFSRVQIMCILLVWDEVSLLSLLGLWMILHVHEQ